jgi:hypothetical protein
MTRCSGCGLPVVRCGICFGWKCGCQTGLSAQHYTDAGEPYIRANADPWAQYSRLVEYRSSRRRGVRL